jgi:hypothetical protein
MNLNSKHDDIFVARKLRKDGVTFHGLHYNSLALVKLRNQVPPLAEVTLRFDPRDLTHAFVRDHGCGREEWIEVFPVGLHAARPEDYRMAPRENKP